MPMTLPSLVILRSELGVELSLHLCHCLELVGVTVVDGLADYVRCHAAVVGSFVRPTTPKNVVNATLTASREIMSPLSSVTTPQRRRSWNCLS